MRTTFALAAAATTLAALLAGCSGSTPPSGLADSLDTSGDAAVVDLSPDVLLRHAGLRDPIHTVVWANGTVAAQDTCNTGGCQVDQRAFRQTPLTGEVVQGVPTLVTIELTWKELPLQFGWFDAYLVAPESTVYAHRVDYTPGHLSTSLLLRPQGELTLAMAAYGPGGDVPSTSYTLSAQLDADPTALLPGVPVAVAMDGGDRITAGSYGGGKATFLLYGPDDALLGSFEGEHVLPASAPKGDYVAVLPAGGPTGNLTSDSGATSMRALGLRQEYGPATDLGPSGITEAKWDVTGVPLGVGVYIHVDDDPAHTFMASSGLVASMAGPNGFELDIGAVCGVCLTGGFGYSADSGSGDPRVTAGTYTVRTESQATLGGTMDPFAIYLQR
jgi:hypothetical protein